MKSSLSCNCNWGCPCQFNALPTTGQCEAFVTCLISDGYFGNTRLDGVVFSRIYWWPGATHEGNGVRRMIIDEQANKEQRDALIAIESGQHGRVDLGDFRCGRPYSDRAALRPNYLQSRS